MGKEKKRQPRGRLKRIDKKTRTDEKYTCGMDGTAEICDKTGEVRLES
jgi:hypothetical protein